MITKEYLAHEYWALSKPIPQIAKQVGLTAQTVRYWFIKYGIPRRTKSDANRLKPRQSHTQNKISVKCAYCSTEKLVWPYDINRSTRHFCNKKCKGLWASKYLVGSTAYNWRGGYWTATVDVLCWTTYRNVREKVLIRDKYKCIVCGTSEHLHVHHIKTKRDYPDLVFAEDNLVTMCKICHIALHRRSCKGGELLETPKAPIPQQNR